MSRALLPLWAAPDAGPAAQHWAHQLADWGQPVQLQDSGVAFAARWLRQHPALALLVDAQGLWLAANGMRMQPDWAGEWPRLRRASVRGELLARACGLGRGEGPPQVLDATAGLGHDALLLAALGAEVTAVERDPVVLALLLDEWRRGQQQPGLAAVLSRLHIQPGHAGLWLRQQAAPEVVYLDPMFPGQAQQAAKVKKPMQLLHQLLQDQADEPALLAQARRVAARVVVKRPRHGAFLEHLPPDQQWLGEAVRFDGYFQASMTAKDRQEKTDGSV